MSAGELEQVTEMAAVGEVQRKVTAVRQDRNVSTQKVKAPGDDAGQHGRMSAMGELQKIIYDGQVAGVVVAGQAVISDGLAEDAERTVKAMCLYALEVTAGLQPGPYTDERALAYARRAGEGARL